MKNNSMLVRTISGVVLLIIVLAAGLIGNILLWLFSISAALVGLYEFYGVCGVYDRDNKKNNGLTITGYVLTVILFVCLLTGIFQKLLVIANNTTILIFIVLMLVISMGIYVFAFPKYTFETIAYAVFGFVYVPVFMSFVYLTRCLEDGKIIFWLIFISSWVCDTCAYFVGVTLGKHKLAPVLSPKKSIEGSIGGIAGSVIVAFLVGYFIEYKMLGGNNNALIYMIICFFGAIVSQIGDLAASGIKRNHDIKDYGNLIPGHGGILDRFDSVIFVAPVIYILAMCMI